MINIEEIKEKQEELNKMIEEYENQKEATKDDLKWDKNWKPNKSEKYYFIDIYNEIDFEFKESSSDEIIITNNRVFKTEKLAEKWLEIDTYLKEKSFEPDWSDNNQIKYSLCYDFDTKKFDVICFRTIYYFIPFYFESIEIKKEILEKYTTEELKFYFNIGE